jgi:hypothetical protein
MRRRYFRLGGVLVATAVTAVPAHGWQASPEDHAKHRPAAPAATKEAGARLDELVAKMNAAQGQAKVDAIAELLTALVQQHQTMHGGMGEMMSKMKKKEGAAAR